MAGHNFDHRLAWLWALVELSKGVPDLHDFVEIVQQASCLLLIDVSHSLLYYAEKDNTLADGIQHCLQAFELIGQNITTSSNYRHWTTDRLVDERFGDQQLRRRIPTGSESSSLISYLICLTVPVFLISPILTRQYDSLTELQQQFVLETALVPHIYSDSDAEIMFYNTSDGCRLGRPTHYCDIIVQMITDGLDVNQVTQRTGCHQHYSVWQFYLLWLHDYFHERLTFREDHSGGQICDHESQIQLIRDTTEVFRTFLIHGADLSAMVSSVDLIACYERSVTVNMATFLSVAEILKDLRTITTSDLADHDDHHGLLTARLAVVGDLEKLLEEAWAQRYLTSLHARAALSATSQPSYLSPS
jgi:hypothetical protein